MVPRRYRKRYKSKAISLAVKHNLKLDTDNWEEIWAILDKYGEQDYLYAIVDPEKNAVKFGRSVSPFARLKQIKTSNSGSLKVWAYCSYEHPFTEKHVHSFLCKYRISGEWFELSDEAKAIIACMRTFAGV